MALIGDPDPDRDPDLDLEPDLDLDRDLGEPDFERGEADLERELDRDLGKRNMLISVYFVPRSCSFQCTFQRDASFNFIF